MPLYGSLWSWASGALPPTLGPVRAERAFQRREECVTSPARRCVLRREPKSRTRVAGRVVTDASSSGLGLDSINRHACIVCSGLALLIAQNNKNLSSQFDNMPFGTGRLRGAAVVGQNGVSL
jgi:hypothetical protein